MGSRGSACSDVVDVIAYHEGVIRFHIPRVEDEPDPVGMGFGRGEFSADDGIEIMAQVEAPEGQGGRGAGVAGEDRSLEGGGAQPRHESVQPFGRQGGPRRFLLMRVHHRQSPAPPRVIDALEHVEMLEDAVMHRAADLASYLGKVDLLGSGERAIQVKDEPSYGIEHGFPVEKSFTHERLPAIVLNVVARFDHLRARTETMVGGSVAIETARDGHDEDPSAALLLLPPNQAVEPS